MSAAFRHKSLVRWETDVIDPIMHDLIDGFADRDGVELVREFTYRFPVQIIAEILGVPHEDHEKFHDMAVWVVNVAANPEKGIAASHALREYLADIVEAKRSHPGDDVISLLVQEELDGESSTTRRSSRSCGCCCRPVRRRRIARRAASSTGC